jgi:hypothetical protein
MRSEYRAQTPLITPKLPMFSFEKSRTMKKTTKTMAKKKMTRRKRTTKATRSERAPICVCGRGVAAGVYSAALGRIGGGQWLFDSNMRISQYATSMG